MPIQPILTVQDQEWQSWRQFKAEQYKQEQELKEFQAWKAAGKQSIVKQQRPKGHEIFRSIWGPPSTQLKPKQLRFAF